MPLVVVLAVVLHEVTHVEGLPLDALDHPIVGRNPIAELLGPTVEPVVGPTREGVGRLAQLDGVMVQSAHRGRSTLEPLLDLLDELHHQQELLGQSRRCPVIVEDALEDSAQSCRALRLNPTAVDTTPTVIRGAGHGLEHVDGLLQMILATLARSQSGRTMTLNRPKHLQCPTELETAVHRPEVERVERDEVDLSDVLVADHLPHLIELTDLTAVVGHPVTNGALESVNARTILVNVVSDPPVACASSEADERRRPRQAFDGERSPIVHNLDDLPVAMIRRIPRVAVRIAIFSHRLLPRFLRDELLPQERDYRAPKRGESTCFCSFCQYKKALDKIGGFFVIDLRLLRYASA